MNRRDGSPNNVKTALVLASIIVVVMIASWFYMRHMELLMSGGKGEVYRNITFTDAFVECKTYTQERYGDKLKSITMHSHSSRWEQDTGQYKLFFKAQIQGRKAGMPPSDYWVNCDVEGREGRIRDFDVIEDKTLKNEAQRMNDGGLFGWP